MGKRRLLRKGKKDAGEKKTVGQCVGIEDRGTLGNNSRSIGRVWEAEIRTRRGTWTGPKGRGQKQKLVPILGAGIVEGVT